MKANRFIFAAGFVFAMALVFFACSNNNDDDGGGDDSSSSFGEVGDESSSSGDAVKLLCGEEEYDANIYRCESGELLGKCRGVDFYPAYQICNNGVIEDKNPLSSSSLSSSSYSEDSSSSSGQSSSSYNEGSSSSSVQSSSSRIVCENNYLGMGYNVITSGYINRDEVLDKNVVLDQDKLCQAGIIITGESALDQDFSISVGKSIKTLYEERNTSLGVGVDFFVGSFGAKFDTKKDESSTTQIYYSQLRSYNYRKADRINTNTQNLSKYLTDEFTNDLKNKTAEQILSQYGTHIFVGYKKGGYLEANYTYSGTQLTSTDSVKKAVEGTYKMFNGSASISSNQQKKDIEESSTFNFKTYGGKLLSATSFAALTKSEYADWIYSIEQGNIDICGIGNFDNSLVPIWELAKDVDAAKATALKNAFDNLVRTQGLAFPKAKMYDTKIIDLDQYTNGGYGSATNYSVSGCSECTIIEAEIYAVGAGGGGQGGDKTWYLLSTDIGTGGAGGGGAAAYLKLGKLNLAKGAAISFDSIAIGKGGNAGVAINQNISGQHSGGNGGTGGATKVVYKGTKVVANGGSGGGNGKASPSTDAGDFGTANVTAGNYYLDGKEYSGTKGSNGDWKDKQGNITSEGGKAGTIPANIGTYPSIFGGGNGATATKAAEPGGGGSGGYSTSNGKAGGNGLLTIVIKYFKEEDKSGSLSSSNITQSTTSSALLWDLSMGMGLSTGGGWYGYDDRDANAGYSGILFRDKTDNQLYPANDVMEWDGGVSFSLDPSGFEYAYAGTGFAWLEGGIAAPTVWGSHTGLCLEYSLSGGGDYYLKIATDGYTEDNEFKVLIPKQTTVAKKLFLLNDFEQGDGWGVIRTLAGAKLASVGMQIQGEAPLATIENGYSGYTETQNGALTLKSISWDSCN